MERGKKTIDYILVYVVGLLTIPAFVGVITLLRKLGVIKEKQGGET